jgi:hypothetical protein
MDRDATLTRRSPAWTAASGRTVSERAVFVHLRASPLLRLTGELIVEVYWRGEHIANISRGFGPSVRIVAKRDVSVEIDPEHPDPATGQPRRAVVGIRCAT